MPSSPERPFGQLSPFEQRLKLLSEREGRKPAQLFDGLSSDTVNKWRRESANGKPPPPGPALHAFATALGVTVEWLLSPAPLARDAEIPSAHALARPAPTPTRTIELDTHRDRLWIQTALEASGYSRGVSYEVALTIQLKGSESPEETLRRAKQAADIAEAHAKGKLITGPQPEHTKEPPTVGDSGTLTEDQFKSLKRRRERIS